MKTCLYVYFAILLLSSLMMNAEVPNTISYQGMLTGSDGQCVSDGAYSLTFKLYTSSSGGSAIRTETHTSVTIR